MAQEVHLFPVTKMANTSKLRDLPFLDGIALVTGVSHPYNLQSLLRNPSTIKAPFTSSSSSTDTHSQAASGIGKETAFQFAEAGCRAVMFCDTNYALAKAAAQQSIKYATAPIYDADAVEIDVTKPELVQYMVDYTIEKFGRIDYCVNAAGVCLPLSSIQFSTYET